MQGQCVRTAQLIFPGNNRGAVFLLAVYVTALFLLVLSGISLQRSTHEQRLSMIARDSQQAFWLAEAGLDAAVNHVKQKGILPALNEALLPLDNPVGYATLQDIVPISAQIDDPNHQEMTADVISKGQTTTGLLRQVKATLHQQGPIGGIWAEGAIVVHGGKEHQQIFLTGNVYSGTGTLVSTVPPAGFQDQEGNVYDGHTWRFQGYSTTADRLALFNDTWPESTPVEIKTAALSLANGYRARELVWGTQDAEVTYNVDVGGGGNEHVAGVLAVGINDDVVGEDFADCSARMLLPSPEQGPVIVDEYDEQGNREAFSYTNPVSDQAGDGLSVGDRDFALGHVKLCVSAMVPASASDFAAGLFADAPPKIVFRQPTTIIVTGNRVFDLSAITVPVKVNDIRHAFTMPYINDVVYFLSGGSAVPLGDATYPYFQAKWRGSIMAEMSAIDRNGNPIPNGVEIIQRHPNSIDGDFSTYGGLVMVKPGVAFSGSIYAPHSTVLVSYRENENQADALQLQLIVGKEVMVQMETDHLYAGPKEGDPRLEDIDTEFLSWTNVQ